MQSDMELMALEEARNAPRLIRAGRVLYGNLDGPTAALNVISGWVMIYQYAAGVRREIVDFALPGDILGGLPVVGAGGLAAAAVTETVLCPIPWASLRKLRERHRDFDTRMLEMHGQTLARSREHLRRLGWRSARERVASLLLELALRARPGEHIRNGEVVAMPLTQQYISDATGLTAIHVNRTLKELREDGVCRLSRGSFWIGRLDELSALAGLGFDLVDDGDAITSH